MFHAQRVAQVGTIINRPNKLQPVNTSLTFTCHNSFIRLLYLHSVNIAFNRARSPKHNPSRRTNMTTSINTNISAYFSQNNLRSASADAQSSIARLSSGNAIIRAADDVAGLSIGTILRTDVSTLRTALTNTSQASSLIQVADGAIERLGEILQRQKALAVQGNADTLSNTERGYLDQEFQALTAEYDRIVSTTEFNGTILLSGNLSGVAADANPLGANGVATTDYTLGGFGTEVTAATIVDLGTVDNSTGAAAIDAFFAATKTATITPDVLQATDYVFDTDSETLVTSIAVSSLGTDDGTVLDAFVAGFGSAAATFTDTNANTSDTLMSLTIIAGGQTFTSGELNFADGSADLADIVLTNSGTNATITVTLGDQSITDDASANTAETALDSCFGKCFN